MKRYESENHPHRFMFPYFPGRKMIFPSCHFLMRIFLRVIFMIPSNVVANQKI